MIFIMIQTASLPLSSFSHVVNPAQFFHLLSVSLTKTNCVLLWLKPPDALKETGQNPVNSRLFFYRCSFLWRTAGMSAIFPSTRDATTSLFFKECVYSETFCWCGIDLLLIYSPAWPGPFVGPFSDHFRCLVPDHEVMAACKHTQHELDPRNVCVSVCVGVRTRQGNCVYIPTPECVCRYCVCLYFVCVKPLRMCVLNYKCLLIFLQVCTYLCFCIMEVDLSSSDTQILKYFSYVQF